MNELESRVSSERRQPGRAERMFCADKKNQYKIFGVAQINYARHLRTIIQSIEIRMFYVESTSFHDVS
jgi:hypothetical protein